MSDDFRFAQLQPFTLAGAGAVIGDTTITLTSMTDIDGNTLSMSTDFGTIGYGTLEPGSGDQEEQISFTGLTNNSNGTTTLTGVKHVGFLYPYTETSGLAKTHAGGTRFVVSNTSGFYNKLTSKSDDETISGTWTFTNPNYPRMDTDTPLPTDSAQLATKAYVDSVAVSGAPNATTGVKGIVQLATQAQFDARTTAGSTGATLVPTPGLIRNVLTHDYAVSSTGNDSYAITVTPAITAYTTGDIYYFKADVANTLACTLDVNAVGAKNIFIGGAATPTGTIAANSVVGVQYDGTQFNIIYVSDIVQTSATAGKVVQRNTTGDVTVNSTPTASTDAASKAYVDANSPIYRTGNTTKDMSATTTTTIAHGLARSPKMVRIFLNRLQTSNASIGNSFISSVGTYDGSTQNALYTAYDGNGSVYASNIDTTHGVHYAFIASGTGADSDKLVGTISVDSTNITITWSKTGSPTGTANIIWEALG